VIRAVLSNQCNRSNHGKSKEHEPCNFVPKLSQYCSKVAEGGTCATQQGAISPSTLYLRSGNASSNSQFSRRGDVRHLFSILPIFGFKITAEANRCAGIEAIWYQTGGIVDQQLKHLMKELGEAINESLADSEQIADVVSRIKDGGYDIFLVLEATIGVSRPGEKSADKTSMVTTLSSNPELKVSDQDLKFLKSLRIKIEDDAA